MRSTIVLLAAVLAGPALANSPRIAAESLERPYPYDAQVAACADPAVLSFIQGRFDHREARYWNSPLRVVGFDHIRETHFRPNGHDLIPRRYCTGRVLLSDNSKARLDYHVLEDQGFSGWHGSLFLGLVRFPTPGSFNVEWCISGLDRHRTYAPDCRMARP
jgi:hypothetical protein